MHSRLVVHVSDFRIPKISPARHTLARSLGSVPARKCAPPPKTAVDTSMHTAQKAHRARLNNLLMAADRLLESKHAHTIQSYIMDKISAHKFYNSYRWVAFTRLIRFSLSRQLFSMAIVLYDRLVSEGFAPPSSIRASMIALKLIDSSEDLQDAVEPLTQVFADESYDTAAFMQLLYFMLSVKKAPVPLIDKLASIYTTTRKIELCSCPDLIGEIVRINTRAGRLDAAQGWLRAFEESCQSEDVGMDASPYAALVHTLMSVDPRNTPALQAILKKMKAAGIPPNISIFNTLMWANVKQGRFREAFELYHVLGAQRSEQLVPSDVTFKILLRAKRLLGQKPRTVRVPNVMEPRQIFRDMLECHLQQTGGQPLGRSSSLSASALQMTLRTFIACKDYLGAFVVVRLLDTFGFTADLQSYRIVLAHLLSRMNREAKSARRPGEYRLADFLMHLRPDEKLDLNAMTSRMQVSQPAAQVSTQGLMSTELHPLPGLLLNSECSSRDVVSHLLELGEPDRHSDEDLLDVIPSTIIHSSVQARRHRRMHVPTLLVLCGEDAPPIDNRCSPIPLARLLQKVFLGTLWASSPSFNPRWHTLVQRVAGDAKKSMVPPMDVTDSAKAAKSRKHLDRKPGLPFALSRRRRSARAGWEIEFVGDDDLSEDKPSRPREERGDGQ
ncbi:hypothetical protein PISMIDRAFT_11959 [Pisolithus microcarpus 441]|uniref:Uncharacterized protein n=1 Tax=Pisolithus microcarpus 441 TaxID=765257 RepID=A0A0C9ZQD7_9AGAM|nr:hypothetical protein PISMIDRAFT_11959 [Pisolithus microcarpus 441]